jgi:ParB-like nuclease domain
MKEDNNPHVQDTFQDATDADAQSIGSEPATESSEHAHAFAFQPHPLCALFPPIKGADFEALKEDIKEHGLRQPIVVCEGLILDGGSRYHACVEVGVEPAMVEFEGDDPTSFVLSANLQRRHLSAGQQAAIVASVQDWAMAKTVGRPEKCGPMTTLLSTSRQRASRSGVSLKTQRRADAVAKANPELARRVARGELPLAHAVKQIAPKAEKERPEVDEAARDSCEDPTDLASGHPDEVGPSPSELAFFEEKEKADRAAYEALIEVSHADDKLASALELVARQAEEIARAKAEVRQLEHSRNGKMNAINEHIRTIKALRRKLEQYEKGAAA